MRSAKVPLVVAAVAMMITACGKKEEFPVITSDGQTQTPAVQQAPVEAQQPQQASDSGVSDMLIGGALGYMLGGMGDNTRERVVERRYYSPPKTASRPAPVVKSVPKPTYKPAPAQRSFSYKPSRSSGRR